MKSNILLRQRMRSLWMMAALLCLLGGLSGCSTISQHDERTVEHAETASRDITGLLIELEEIGKQEPECSYENFSERYRAIKVGLNTFSLREQAKLQNSETIEMVENLSGSLNKLVTLHRGGCLSVGEITLLQKQFNSLAGSILKVENAKPQPLF